MTSTESQPREEDSLQFPMERGSVNSNFAHLFITAVIAMFPVVQIIELRHHLYDDFYFLDQASDAANDEDAHVPLAQTVDRGMRMHEHQ